MSSRTTNKCYENLPKRCFSLKTISSNRKGVLQSVPEIIEEMVSRTEILMENYQTKG